MPNLRDIRRRITSVKKTQQITRAMRMVAGAKLRRAQEASASARPYADRMRDTVTAVSRAERNAEHPLLLQRSPIARVELLVVTSNRGLCGAFNSNIIKCALVQIAEREAAQAEVFITASGRKASDYFRRRAGRLVHSHVAEGWVVYGHAVEIASRLCQRYVDGEVDEVLLVYSEFVSTMTQRPKSVRLLPQDPGADESDGALPYEIEPSPARLLEALLPKAVEVEIFRALLENQVGEYAARMTAMESATRNTQELVERLTLQFNRARQAAITKELVEIVTGAEAL